MLKSNQFRETDDISGLKLTMTVGQKKTGWKKVKSVLPISFLLKMLQNIDINSIITDVSTQRNGPRAMKMLTI